MARQKNRIHRFAIKVWQKVINAKFVNELKENKLLRCFLLILLIMITVGAGGFCWSLYVGKSGVFLGFIADNMLSALFAIPEAISLIIGTLCAIIKDKKHTLVCAFVAVFFALVLFCAAGLKVISTIRTEIEESKETQLEQVEKIPISSQAEPVYQKSVYILEKDVFVETLEAYCGVPEHTIPVDEEVDKMVEIVGEYLKNAVSDVVGEELPVEYEEEVLFADTLYGIYISLIKEAEEKGNKSIQGKIHEYRIQVLLDARAARVRGEESYQSAENRRMIGRYDLDLGVEYQKADDYESAAEYYESAASWSVKAIYTAASINDKAKMRDALEVLNDAVLRLQEMETYIGDGRIKKVERCKEAYTRVINNWQ